MRSLSKKVKKERSPAIKAAAALLAFLIFALGQSGPAKALCEGPPAYYASSRTELEEKTSAYSSSGAYAVAASCSSDETLGGAAVEYRLLGLVTLKKVPAVICERPQLIPGGEPVGISIRSRGVLIVGFEKKGEKASPAARAGLRPGDLILTVNGREVSSAEELSAALLSSGPNLVTAEREGKLLEFTVEAPGKDGARLGAWVRDGTVGVGTLSFIAEEEGFAAALGHPVLDADTGVLIPVGSGRLTIARVLGVTPGRQGAPGELVGSFGDESPSIGSVFANTRLGVYAALEGNLPFTPHASIPAAFPDEVKTGEATVICSASGEPKEYSCRIIRVSRQSAPAAKGMIIEITDEELLSLTGGIVQGMSGSPILQGGRLVGAVTHVFVNDPRRGYGAFAYWMYQEGTAGNER